MASPAASVGSPPLALARAATASQVLSFLGPSIAVGALAAANGGYFPGSWGWASLGFAWAAALTLTTRRSVTLGRLELTFVGLLAALAGWYLLSTLWSPTVPSSVFEAERALVYPAGVAAGLLVARRVAVPQLVGGLLTGIAAVDLYALATRLLPDRIGSYDAVATYRLATPIGYWNGLGIFSAIGILLALAIAAHGRTSAARAAAGALVPVLACTLYFTFSRGTWIALALGLVTAAAVDSRQLRSIAVGLVLAAPAAGIVWLASRAPALTTQGAAASAAARAGHRVALELLVASLAAAALAVAVGIAVRRVDASRRVRTACGTALIVAAVALLAGGLVRLGGPAHVARKAWHSFTTAPPTVVPGHALNQRLFSLSSNGRIDLWRGAWHESQAHPLLGGGAGSYEEWWLSHRPSPAKVRDAHSLYLETLAELGPIGLALLLLALATPLLALRQARRQPLVPFALAAYVAYLVHAAADWDWELSAVTLAALLCGAVVLVAARDSETPPLGRRARGIGAGVAAAVACAALVVAIGNSSLSSSAGAAADGNWQSSARDARRATRWAPWASEPWRLLGEAQLAQGETAAARSSFGEAIAKDRNDWQGWFDLARASTGRAQLAALRRAQRLDPLAPEIAELKTELGL